MGSGFCGVRRSERFGYMAPGVPFLRPPLGMSIARCYDLSMTCAIEVCDRPKHARGFCKRHYEAARLRGDFAPRVPVDHLGAYRDRAVGSRESECWPWVGAMKPDGYGLLNFREDSGRRTSINAHRAVYQMLVGPIPSGLVLDHLCCNTACVNPAHLEPVTNGENVRRGLTSRGVFACGHPLSPENTIQAKTTRKCRTCTRVRDAALKRRWRAEDPERKARMYAVTERWRAKQAAERHATAGLSAGEVS